MEVTARVRLLRHTGDPERAVALAAKLCYSAVGIDKLSEKIEKGEVREFLKRLLEMRHLSPFEHASFTFGVEGISRVTSHQLVRHRIASYSQQSQRYVKKTGGLEYVIPPSIAGNGVLKAQYGRVMAELQDTYRQFAEAGIAAEDARYVLPNAAETKMVVTMNARELRHFFQQRCCTRAQWEIRKMAELMLERVREVAPTLFADCGPLCVSGFCPEGDMSCGRVTSKSGKGEKPHARIKARRSKHPITRE
ncbi:FAD-dependent thymidylate synthase [Candidatus Poribacteria bacterium]|nr:FAD-dependent thymidylate synthase [Candidatus Poribacteria bacterium]